MSTTIASSLFGRTRRNVLGVLFGRPDEQFYLRELARVAEVAPGAIQRELARLTEAGIILRSVRGNQVYYQANATCPIYAELVGLITKTVGLTDVLRSSLAPLVQGIRVAFIYGSVARGELTKGSDVDLMIVGSINFSQVVAAIAPVQQKLAREVNPTVYPVAEFRRKIAEGHHFLQTVTREPKVFLVGDERELAGLAQERLGERTSHESAGDR